jgi:uncharacterized protein YecE (DUF72 family)
MRMQWYAGTSGYSYKEWRGSFYPDDLKPEDMLAYYATRLPAVEINNTFYRMPRTEVLEGWAAAVPEAFRFVIKASRRITHQSQLANVEEPVGYLARGVAVLGERLGGVLFQLPPHLRRNDERLAALLACWPRELPAAIEFRHESWHDDAVFEQLQRHGVALCISQDEKLPIPEQVATADWVYLRLRRATYANAELGTWLRKAQASGANTGYAFFKHEDEAGGPQLAERFLNLAARPEPRRAARRRAPAEAAQPKAKERAAPAKAARARAAPSSSGRTSASKRKR